MYVPSLMLRNLVAGEMTSGERRQADEQLGRIAAAVTRRGRRLVRARAVPACWAGHHGARVAPPPSCGAAGAQVPPPYAG